MTTEHEENKARIADLALVVAGVANTLADVEEDEAVRDRLRALAALAVYRERHENPGPMTARGLTGVAMSLLGLQRDEARARINSALDDLIDALRVQSALTKQQRELARRHTGD